MAFIEYVLEKFRDHTAFEQLCCAVLLRDGYSTITPMGGTDDKGRDAEDTVYEGTAGKRRILFQFSLQVSIAKKVRATLARLKETRQKAHEVIFMFNTVASPGLRDRLADEALRTYGWNIAIRDQQYLTIRLGDPAYLDIARCYFSRDIADLKTHLDSNTLFSTNSAQVEEEKRVLVNVLAYGQHAVSKDIRVQIIRQAVRAVLATCSGNAASEDSILSWVKTYLPGTVPWDDSAIRSEIGQLVQMQELQSDGQVVKLSAAPLQEVEMDVAELLAGKRALVDLLSVGCSGDPTLSVDARRLSSFLDAFLTQLFRKYGHEVASSLLDSVQQASNLTTALEPDNVEALLSTHLSGWPPAVSNRIRSTMKSFFRNPSGPGLQYLSALARSYICMQLLKADPAGVNWHRSRITDSVAVVDTDVVLSGIVRGADRERASRALVTMCLRLGIRCFAFDHTLQEIPLRIQRSIALFEDLGRPALIPNDKSALVSDLFLDVYFRELYEGKVSGFEEFITYYFDLGAPQKHIERLIDERLDIRVESIAGFYIMDQENKVNGIKKTIEESRKQAQAFKNPKLYYNDAKAMVTVEQQNRQMQETGKHGRWYLVSSDRHMLNAYLKHNAGFKTKPTILPIHFMELLRQWPEAGADEQAFGAILRSEAMLRGTGRNYAPVVAALTKLGIQALEMPNRRLLELIDEMDRADLTKWLLRIRSGGVAIDEEMREEIRTAIEQMAIESASRSDLALQQLERLKAIAANSGVEESDES